MSVSDSSRVSISVSGDSNDMNVIINSNSATVSEEQKVGPAGPAGPAGPIGPAGPTGPTGPTGPIGTIDTSVTYNLNKNLDFYTLDNSNVFKLTSKQQPYYDNNKLSTSFTSGLFGPADNTNISNPVYNKLYNMYYVVIQLAIYAFDSDTNNIVWVNNSEKINRDLPNKVVDRDLSNNPIIAELADIRYTPCVSLDGKKLYFTTTELFSFKNSLALFILDAKTGDLITQKSINVNSWPGTSENLVPMGLTCSIRTNTIISPYYYEGTSKELVYFGATSLIEYIPQYTGITNPSDSLNVSDINGLGLKGVLTCLAVNTSSNNIEEYSVDVCWNRFTCPSDLYGIGGPGSTNSTDISSRDLSACEIFGTPNITRSVYPNNESKSSINLADLSADYLSKDSFIGSEPIQMLVPMNNVGYPLYLDDLSNANHNIEQNLVVKNTLKCTNIKDSSSINIPCSAFIASKQIFNGYLHSYPYGPTIPTNNGSLSVKSGKYDLSYAPIPHDLSSNTNFIHDNSGSQYYSMVIGDLLIVKDVSGHGDSAVQTTFNGNNVFKIYKINYADNTKLTDPSIDTTLYSGSDASACYILNDIERLFAKCHFKHGTDLSYQIVSENNSIDLSVNEFVHFNLTNSILDNSNTSILEPSKEDFSVNSLMLNTQFVIKQLDISLTDISYQLDSAEAYRLNYYGSGLWGQLSFDELNDEILVPVGNGNAMPLHEQFRFSDCSLNDSSGNYLWYTNYYFNNLYNECSGGSIDNLLSKPYDNYAISYLYPLLAISQKLFKEPSCVDVSDQILEFIENLENNIYNQQKNRLLTFTDRLSPRGSKFLNNTGVGIDSKTGKIKWRGKSLDHADVGWTYNKNYPNAFMQYSQFTETKEQWLSNPNTKYNYNYSSILTQDDAIEYYLLGTDNDCGLPINKLSNNKFIILPSKGGNIYKYSYNDISYNSYLDMSFITTESINATRLLGANSIGDINYGYSYNNNFVVTQSKNISDQGVVYLTVSNNEVLTDISRGIPLLVISDISSNKSTFIPCINNTIPHSFLTTVRHFNEISNNSLIAFCGDNNGQLNFVNTKNVSFDSSNQLDPNNQTPSVYKISQTGVPVGRSSLFVNNNTIISTGGMSTAISGLGGFSLGFGSISNPMAYPTNSKSGIFSYNTTGDYVKKETF